MTQQAWGESSQEAPTCPRHPGVVTYVRCQRCGRPTCPQCQRPAAVGVQCVDCVKAQQQTQRRTVTVAGGVARSGTPVVTYAIIALSTAVFLGQLATTQVQRTLMFVPVLGQSEPWRFLTTAFLHGSVVHILMNMYALYLIGPFVEQVFGRWRYVSMYALAAIGGSVSVLLLSSPTSDSWVTGTVGASGAVFGLFGALALTMKRLKRNQTQVLVVIGINIVFSFMFPNVSWEAHLGGLLTGSVLAAAYLYSPKEHRTAWAICATAAIAVLLVGLTWLKYA